MIGKLILTGIFLFVFLLRAQQNVAFFASGCFWCVEAIFETVDGVIDAQSGYCGGKLLNPTYAQICTGKTGHAETVKVTFRPNKVTYTELLEIFFDSHDPTTLNQQGPDKGTQYRSAIFYQTDIQKNIAENSKKKKDKSGKFDSPIVTEITKASTFYAAEDYHQDFFENNKTYGYCRAVIWPKLAKLGMLKEE